MDPEPNAPTEPQASTPAPAAEPAAAKPATLAVPPSVLILGFVVVVLLGVLVAISLRPKEKVAASDDSAIRDLKGSLLAERENLNQRRLSQGLTPLSAGGGLESAEVVAKRITDDAATLVGLSKGSVDLIAAKEAEYARTSKELADALQAQAMLREKNQDLMVEASTAMLARRDLEKANAVIASMQKDIERLSKGPAEMGQVMAERDRMRAQVAELQARIAELQAQASKSSLFAGTESQLFKEAVELFRSLRTLENKTDSEITQAYSQYGLKMGASVFGQISFPTGSSELAPTDVERVRSFVGEAADNAYIIVIGYASETGNVDDNRVLSSDRATAVAQILDAAKKPGQHVQAAYLGQTDRFGSRVPERNQICEVWQILPKNGSGGASSPQRMSSDLPPPPAPGH